MKKIKLLIVEDNSIDKRLMEEHLSEVEDIEFEFGHAFRLKEAFNLLNHEHFDIVTLDLGLPDSHGLETFEKFQTAFPNVPTIVVSGYEDKEIAKKVITGGAHGFLVKGNYDQDSLIKEIKLAINKQGFRTTVASKISQMNRPQETPIKITAESERKQELFFTPKTLKMSRLVEKEPEIFQELVTEYLQLVPISSETNATMLKEKVSSFFEKNEEAFAMLNLTKEDLLDVHTAAIERLNFIDKGNSNFKSLVAILLHEVNLVFTAINTKTQ